ncbi:MAG: NAD(P)/FAD-dependent oxidoreductase [Candidatus Aenigmarchaeota archaeon]|nr:NAD(P)/FAD-dependent oxidoreductase [Candidatus Aenigmarchaeota archaeon]
MKNTYDVIILGAGPAGLKCAEELKNTKLSVLLIEKNQIIGPKICAGGLTQLTKGFDYPKDKTIIFNKLEIFLGNKKYEISMNNPIRTLDRYELGQYMFTKIKNTKNITILKKTLVKSMEKNKIKTSRGTFHFKYLVGADGAASIVRKYLGLENKIYIGIQYIIPKQYKKMKWFFNPKTLYSGYGWVFPHKTYTSAGVFFNPKFLKVNKAREILDKFLDDCGVDYKKAQYEGAPANCLYKGIKFDNIFLAGDAAGLTSAATGEGISFALTSGKEVAKKIINPNHKTIELDKIVKIKQKGDNRLEFLDRFPLFQSILLRIYVNLLKSSKFQSWL